MRRLGDHRLAHDTRFASEYRMKAGSQAQVDRWRRSHGDQLGAQWHIVVRVHSGLCESPTSGDICVCGSNRMENLLKAHVWSRTGAARQKAARNKAARKGSATRLRRQLRETSVIVSSYLEIGRSTPSDLCRRCREALTNQVSIERGIGPECYGRIVNLIGPARMQRAGHCKLAELWAGVSRTCPLAGAWIKIPQVTSCLQNGFPSNPLSPPQTGAPSGWQHVTLSGENRKPRPAIRTVAKKFTRPKKFARLTITL